jgi:3-phosphoshikimate 1-carboxyvinyltransferase
MRKLTSCHEIRGKVGAPPSKSMMIRAVAAALLARGKSEIINPSFCQDSLAALSVARGLGARTSSQKNKVILEGGLKPERQILDCGESGLSLRMFAPLAALQDTKFSLSGSGSLMNRPVFMMEKPFQDLGVIFSSRNGFPPVSVKGPLIGGEAVVDGSVSSQFLTGLLIALPIAEKDSFVRIINLKSKPYIHMTIRFLENLGLTIFNRNDAEVVIPGKQNYRPFTYRVEGDWSSAAFLLVAGAVGGEVEVTGLDPGSCQADRKILQALEAGGAEIRSTEACIRVRKRRLEAFEFDCTDCPDLFPPLVALACQCKGKSVLRGVERLRHKESDRASSLVEEFSRLGTNIRLERDSLEVWHSKIRGGRVSSHNDHRIAMALAIAAINAYGDIDIEGSECVAKSYPDFFRDLAHIGGKIHE